MSRLRNCWERFGGGGNSPQVDEFHSAARQPLAFSHDGLELPVADPQAPFVERLESIEKALRIFSSTHAQQFTNISRRLTELERASLQDTSSGPDVASSFAQANALSECIAALKGRIDSLDSNASAPTRSKTPQLSAPVEIKSTDDDLLRKLLAASLEQARGLEALKSIIYGEPPACEQANSEAMPELSKAAAAFDEQVRRCSHPPNGMPRSPVEGVRQNNKRVSFSMSANNQARDLGFAIERLDSVCRQMGKVQQEVAANCTELQALQQAVNALQSQAAGDCGGSPDEACRLMPVIAGASSCSSAAADKLSSLQQEVDLLKGVLFGETADQDVDFREVDELRDVVSHLGQVRRQSSASSVDKTELAELSAGLDELREEVQILKMELFGDCAASSNRGAHMLAAAAASFAQVRADSPRIVD